jgi:hypothetical protein
MHIADAYFPMITSGKLFIHCSKHGWQFMAKIHFSTNGWTTPNQWLIAITYD